MATPDPIAPIVNALSFLVAPNPTLDTTTPQPPTTWTGAGSNATEKTLFVPVQQLLGILFGASGDLTELGNGINGAMTAVASALATIAEQVSALTMTVADAQAAFTAVQSALGLAAALAPADSTLQSASGLFQQLGSVLAALGDVGLAAAELAELSQQLTAAASLFPPS